MSMISLLVNIFIIGFQWSQPQHVSSGWVSRLGLDDQDTLLCLIGRENRIYYSYHADTLWSVPETICPGMNTDISCGFDLVRAKDSKLWGLASAAGFGPILFYYRSNVWSDTFGASGLAHNSLVTDSGGRTLMLFDGSEYDRIFYNECIDTVWTGPNTVCHYPGHNQVISSYGTVTPDGVRWAGGLALTIPMDQIFLTFSDTNGIWTDSIIKGPQTHDGWSGLSDIISDHNSNIWVTWCNLYTDSIYTAYLDTNFSWSPTFQIAPLLIGNLQRNPQFAVDRYNRIWLIYCSDSLLFCRVWNGSQWSVAEQVANLSVYGAEWGDVLYDNSRNRIWVSFAEQWTQIFTTWTDASIGINENNLLINNTPDIIITPTIITRSKLVVLHAFHTDSNKQKFIDIHDCSGRQIKHIETLRKELTWDCKDNMGTQVPPGIYFASIRFSNEYWHIKICIIN